MNEQADPWDDSALVNAFDNAIAKYKKMHKKTQPSHHSNSNQHQEEENVVIETAEEAATIPPTTISSSENVEDVNDSSITEENQQTDSHAQEHNKQISDVTHTQENFERYTNLQGVDESNELYKQYCELEEQRQKVLQQLQQSGYWNYQCSVEGSVPSGQWGTCSAQEHQYSNQQASHPAVVSYCCSCVCPCMVTPSLMPACSLGGSSAIQNHSESTSDPCVKAPDKAPSLEDDPMVKTAIGAAERAMASMNLNASSSNINRGSPEVQMTQNISPEADLSVVLNAWYLAGFHTGKYLSEQSNAKGRRG